MEKVIVRYKYIESAPYPIDIFAQLVVLLTNNKGEKEKEVFR